LTLDINLQKAARLALRVHRRDGKPLAGATVREITMQGPNGRVWLHENVFKMIDLEPTPSDKAGSDKAPSDKAGLLRLPPLPAGDLATMILIDHPDFAPIELKGVRIEDITVDASMAPGVKLAFHFHPARSISKVYLDLRHEPFDHPSTIFKWFPVPSDGIVTLTVAPGHYQSLVLTHADYLISPKLDMDYSHWKDFVEFSGQQQTVNFFLHAKVTVRGRVVSGLTGNPIDDTVVTADIPNYSTDRNKSIRRKWLHADRTDTNSKGEFQLKVAAGKFHVTLQQKHLTSPLDNVELEAATDGSTVVPDIRAFLAPTIIGRVLRPDGTPAAHTVVRFRGRRLAGVQPVLTDSQGHFELQSPFIPHDAESGRNLYNHPVVAFDAYEPLAARTDVRLDEPQTFTNITLQLHHEPYEDELHDIGGDLSLWGRRDPSDVEGARALRDLAKKDLRGMRPPELTGARWLNVPDPKSTTHLGSFAGKYVLLDFWAIWCGPCLAEYPSLKLAQQLYGDRLTVIGIHGNTVPPALIAEHVKQQKLTYPIAIDLPDNRLDQTYTKLGLFGGGYPSHVLLSPEGKILDYDAAETGPADLCRFKLEMIRAALMGRMKGKDEGGRMKDEPN
jgi:thiol-disulfide isomerase/thioredoxin